MAQVLDMPNLSDTMTEGVLRKWHRKEGDKVAPGDVLAEVETDKATMDYESFDKGVLLKLLIKDGETVPVGTPIAILGQAGEDVAPALAEVESRKAAGAAKPAAKAAPEPPKAEPAPKAAAAKPEPATSPRRAAAARPAAPRPAPTSAPNGKILASPLARKLAGELGVDLRSLSGSGPGGRI